MAGYAILDNVAVKEIASNKIRENLVQGIIVVPNKAANFEYVEDYDGNSVTVQRTKMGTNQGRIMADGVKNGGYLNANKNTIQSDLTVIPLNFTYDAVTDVPQNALNMNGSGRLLDSILLNATKDIQRFVNLAYLATVITANLNAAISATSSSGSITYAISDKYVTKATSTDAQGAMDAFYKAAANLEAGDIDNGYDIFPTTDTEIIVRSSYRYSLMNNAGVFTGNFLAQQMVASGSFTAFDTEYTPNLITGYVGELNGALVYSAGNLFDQVEGWLGQTTIANGTQEALTKGALANVEAVYVCGMGIGGGVDRRSEVKVVDLQGGQGVQVQPLVRCGFAAFSPKAIQIITNTTGITASNFVTYTGSASVATQTKKLAPYLPGNR